MIDLCVKSPKVCKIEKNITSYGVDQMLSITMSFDEDYTFQRGEFFIGLKASHVSMERVFLMTHEQTVTRYKVPFAFPAFMGHFLGDKTFGGWVVVDYYQLHEAFSMYEKMSSDDDVFFGLSSEPFDVHQGDRIHFSMIYHLYQEDAPRLTSMIQLCAAHVLNAKPIILQQGLSLSTNVYNYDDAAYGLSRDLSDDRARIQDGVGTFIPYGYLEKKPYSESFALMDVAKGMLPYAMRTKNDRIQSMLFDELLKMTDLAKPYPWITYDHNTEGFFHLAWGSLPVGVTEDYIKTQSLGLFSDVDGHEEGPNLLSTWKYFYRVKLLGEMALLSSHPQIMDGFMKTLPFINKLKLDNYAQPVTYDLDTHEKATGYHDGGSAGGAALWSLIHLTAYQATHDQTYLIEALKGLNHANNLDFDRYYSMRVAPKPVTAGYLTKANVYAYELTQDDTYLCYAKEVAQSIYFFYYISPHPYAYFSTMGYGYACSRERWEAFLEMVESLYNVSFYLKYNTDKTLLKLYWYARENWLWALPLNGNPYGNLDRPYDSIGNTYIPYEFSTGSLGDNPGHEGGSQSSMRQIKEIYGSGEVYLAFMMFEMHATISDRNFLIVKSDRVNDLMNPNMNFIIYNTQKDSKACVVSFHHLTNEFYDLYQDRLMMGTYHRSLLMMGIKLVVGGDEKTHLALKTSQSTSPQLEKMSHDLNVMCSGFESLYVSWNPSLQEGHTHYKITVKNDLYVRTFDILEESFKLTLDRELDHVIDIASVSPHGIVQSKPIKVPCLEKEYTYRLTEDKKHHLSYEHADLIYDGHLWMFYGHAYQKHITARVMIDSTFDSSHLLHIEVASLNTHCHYDIHIHHNENVTSSFLNLSEASLSEIAISKLQNNHISSIEIIAYGSSGLGFSLKRIDVLLTHDVCEQKVYNLSDLIPKYMNNLYVIEKVLDTTGHAFIDLYIDGLTKGSDVKIYLDNQEVFMPIEEKHPNKIYRDMNTIYRFRSNLKQTTTLMITSHTRSMKVLSIRMTSDLQHPKYAEYRLRKEDYYAK